MGHTDIILQQNNKAIRAVRKVSTFSEVGCHTLAMTRFILVDFSTVIYWRSPFIIRGSSGLFYRFYIIFNEKWEEKNTVDSDLTSHHVASDLGQHCLPMTLLWVSR